MIHRNTKKVTRKQVMSAATERMFGLIRLIAKTSMRRSVIASVNKSLDSDFTEPPRLSLVSGSEFVNPIVKIPFSPYPFTFRNERYIIAYLPNNFKN